MAKKKLPEPRFTKGAKVRCNLHFLHLIVTLLLLVYGFPLNSSSGSPPQQGHESITSAIKSLPVCGWYVVCSNLLILVYFDSEKHFNGNAS